MQLFFTNDIEDNIAILPTEEARHCLQALRKKTGDPVAFVDGKGGFYEGTILEASKKRCSIRITSHKEQPPQPEVHLHLAIAPTKNIGRLEWFLEKATEFGISEITPILCDRSERRKLRLDRLEKIILSAMKQSLKAWLPKINDLTKFEDLINQEVTADSQQFIAYCNDEQRIPLKEGYRPGKNVLILIGPEGDFTEKEVGMAFDQGFTGVSLGESRLRTETAGLAACHIINLFN